MARRVFFSFHYEPDVQRAQTVKNSWVTKSDREDAGFFDSSVFESKKRTSPDALKRFLDAGLLNSSVTCVLAGEHTHSRRWVRYEILRSFVEGKGLLNIAIHGVKNFEKKTAIAGLNPFSCLGAEVKGDVLRFKEKNGATWEWSADVPSMKLSSVRYSLNGRANFLLDVLFPSYDWASGDGYNKFPDWVERAAKAAGR